MLKYAVVMAVSLALAVSGAVGLTRNEDPAATASAVLAAPDPLSASGADPAAAVAALEAQVERVPRDHRAWADLGLAYFSLAGEELDAELFDQADRAIERSLEIEPDDNVRALANQAAISASHHQFVDALDQAEATLAIAPYDPTALAIRIDALTQLGRFADLLPAVREADRRQPGVPVVSRWSYAVELDGRFEEARRILLRGTDSASRDELSHLLSHAADLDRRQGRLRAAARRLDRADAAAPGDVDVQVGRALLAQARGDLAEARRTWQGVVRSDPLPEHYLALGELLEHLGRDAEAAAAYDRSREAVDLLARGGANIDGELAQFLVDHGEVADRAEALALGRAEATRSRGVHASDAYAWALHASGRHQEALTYARLATRRGTREAILWIHRGTIEAALGLDGAARRHLTAGIAMDPGLSPWQLARAREVLAELGQPVAAGLGQARGRKRP